MLFHVIDKDSPLHGLTASDLTDGDALLVVLNVGGVDDSSTQQLNARPSLFMARYPLAASVQRYHECFAAGSFLARLH
jgi:hypothetical protein